ncbi:MAG: transcriptional regulator [Brevundimonas sp.]|uniref:winged helix-turn-helix transcriptional regulator n=1 Tax=Brevundimonas sp. TaxID=1871086 RepID=UPI00121E346A|nr:winged helix-turn-helix transcriptional regulator [Brevundimonas sp.]RZJ18062.1 MAG: transcriptional regulator [Brevundimonas sp.]
MANASRRWYDDACGTAHALELVGERWSLLIMRELMLGPRRFGDLRASLPGLSANILTQRLDSLEGTGILRRLRLPPPASVQVYELTRWGLEAEPIIRDLGRWAARSPRHDPTLPLSPVSLMLSFRTMFDAAKAGAASLTLGFVLGEEEFTVCVHEGELNADRGRAGEADARITASPEVVAGAVYGDPAALAGAELSIEGDRTAFLTFAGFFELPPKAI